MLDNKHIAKKGRNRFDKKSQNNHIFIIHLTDLHWTTGSSNQPDNV